MDDQKNIFNEPNIAPINGAPFYCKFLLTGPDGGEIDFTKSSIISFDLEENFFEPFITASMTVNNPFDYVESTVAIRGDGKERMHVTFYNASLDDQERKEQNLPPIKDVQVDYTFVVNNENNDVSKTDRSNNFKTFQLVDENYLKLNEKIPYGKRYQGYIGDIIADILEEVLGEGIIDYFQWEPGSHKIDRFPEFIIPPISFRYSDLLKYLLRIYYFDSGGLPVQGMLNFDRAAKQFTLTPISQLFLANQELTQEAFGVDDLVGETGKDGNSVVNENNPFSDPAILANVYQHQLRNTNLTTPMLVYSNEFFTNYSISTGDQKTGIEYKELIAIKDIKDKWKKIFVDSFKCIGGAPKAFLPIKQEKTNISKPFILPFNSTVVRNLAIAQMVSNLTFYNLQLNLDNPGDTNRRPGKFIDVFKMDKNITKVDPKLLGRWFVTKVHHRFFQDSYQNVIQGIKAYVGPTSNIADDPGYVPR